MAPKKETGAAAENETAAPANELQKEVAEELKKPSPDLSYQDEIVIDLRRPIEVIRDGDTVKIEKLTMRPPEAEFYFATGDHVQDIATTMPNGEQAFAPKRQLSVVRKYLLHMIVETLSEHDLNDLHFYDIKQLEAAFDRLIEPF